MKVLGRFALATLAASWALLVSSPPAEAAVVTLAPSRDNSLFEDNGNRSCGIGPLFGGATVTTAAPAGRPDTSRIDEAARVASANRPRTFISIPLRCGATRRLVRKSTSNRPRRPPESYPARPVWVIIPGSS